MPPDPRTYVSNLRRWPEACARAAAASAALALPAWEHRHTRRTPRRALEALEQALAAPGGALEELEALSVELVEMLPDESWELIQRPGAIDVSEAAEELGLDERSFRRLARGRGLTIARNPLCDDDLPDPLGELDDWDELWEDVVDRQALWAWPDLNAKWAIQCAAAAVIALRSGELERAPELHGPAQGLPYGSFVYNAASAAGYAARAADPEAVREAVAQVVGAAV